MANFYNPYQQYYSQTPIQPSLQQTQSALPQTVLNSGFVSVRSEMEARNYPVAPGNSITFKDETAPYVYTKTMGFSQLDRPNFEKYKLVKEDITEEEVKENPNLIDELKNRMNELNDEIDELRGELNAIKKNMDKPTPTANRRKKDGDVRDDE